MSTTDETIDKVSKEIGKLRSSINRDATILLVVAIMLFAVFLGYFIFGYNKFKEISEPNLLMDAAETIVSDHMTEARKHLQSEVDKNAEAWVEQLSDQAIESVDDMRVELEKFVEQQIKDKIKESVKVADPQFEQLMAENNEVLKKAFVDFGNSKKTSNELVEVVTAEVDDRLKTNLQSDASEVLNMMLSLKLKMEKLRGSGELNEEESLERQILATARLIQNKNQSN